jgi:hypothetical protein
MAARTEGPGTLYSEEIKMRVQQQLERLLGNVHFSNSKRFPSFLRFIVREELEGRGDQLKERTLGIEVFGRDAGYDTTSDPIVRVTAAEIRKRIAQYYQESGHADEMRISLPPGSYIPHFVWPHAELAAEPAGTPKHGFENEPHFISQPKTDPSVESVNIGKPASPPCGARSWLVIAGAAVLAGMIAITGWLWMRPRPSMLDRFWAPILSSGDPVVVCFPQSHFNGIMLRDAAEPGHQKQLQEQMSTVIVDDLQPLLSVSGLLEMRKQRYTLIGEDTATLTDLRRGPAIFLGAFDNGWTLRVTRNLRYRFMNDPEMTLFWIEDTQSTSHPRWAIDRKQQVKTNNYRDYAIVARFLDANTGKLAVVVAGIARGGTVAAGEFLTQPGNMEAIKAHAPRNWAGQNMEFVLSTEIIDGRSSPPKVEATYFW